MTATVEFMDAVASRLASDAPSPWRHYLIVDQAALHGIDVSRELRWNAVPIDLLTRRAVDWAHGASPVMVEAPGHIQFDQLRLRAWQRFAHRCRYTNALTLVATQLQPGELADTLEQRLKARLAGGMDVVLRWFDGRVMDALLSVLDDDQRHVFLEPCTEWIWQTRHGTAHIQRAPAAPAHSRVALPLALSQHQESKLVGLAEADSIVDVLLSQGHAELSQMIPPEQHSRVASLLRSARAHEIDQAPDQTAFCSIGLTLGPEFHTQPPWSDMLVQCSKRSARFGELLSAFARTAA